MRCKILLITRSVLTEEFFHAVAEALKGLDADLKTLYLESYDVDDVARELSMVETPDVVLLSLMGDRRELLQLLEERFKEARAVFPLSTGGEVLMLPKVRGIYLGNYLNGALSPLRGVTGSSFFDPKELASAIRNASRTANCPAARYLEDWALLVEYWHNFRVENIVNMMRLILRNYCELPVPEPQPPVILGDYWVEDSNGFFGSAKEYLSQKGGRRPSAVILAYSGQSYYKGRKAALGLARLMGDVAIVFSSYGRAVEAMVDLGGADVVLNLLWFRLARSQEDSKALLQINAPILGPVVMYGRDLAKWRESPAGLSPVELIYAVAMPEIDGVIEPIPIAGLVDRNGLKVAEVLHNRSERVAGRAEKWLNLRRKPNKDKKIAVVIYNYPPGEENIGRAASLDTLKSVENLLKALKRAGYNVEEITAEELMRFFVVNPNSGRWFAGPNYLLVDVESYKSLFDKLSPELRERIISQWGEPPGDVMVRGGALALPLLQLGNAVVVLQPPRGWHENPDKIYHSSELYPHHQYVALYRWLEEVWGADAVIHVGTHGTLEFLPGKQVGLSSSCPPDALLGNLPNVYIYHVVVVGEGTIAKRRSYAVLVSHLSPRLTEAGLNDDLRKLRDLLDEYREASLADPPRADAVLRAIKELAGKYGLGELDVESLHDELARMERAAMPYGLRILGAAVSDDEVEDYLALALRRDGGVKSLYRLLAEARGLNYDELLERPGLYAQELRTIGDTAREIIRALITRGVDRAVAVATTHGVPEEEAREILKYAASLAERLRLSPRLELENVVRALNGEYVPAGIGGDYVLDPDVLPAGRNFYALDPLKIPSDAAVEIGARIADESIEKYVKQFGRYPETIGVVLWGGQEARTRGVSIGQILRYLGVRIKRRPGTSEPDVEAIPLEELGRPRIDVLATMSGVFRDMFPHLVVLINKAVRLVALLDEPLETNFVRKHYLEMREKYGESALIRTFSERPGDYGNKVNHLIETSHWKNDMDIAEVYLSHMSFGYGGDMSEVRAQSLADMFKYLLSKVDITSQIQSSIDYSIIDIDDYYAYLGGLAKAVEVYSGKKPLVLYADLSQEKPRVQEAKDAVGFYVRTRLLNPKWIEGMRGHGYMGAQNISKRVEHLLGLAATADAVEDWVWDRVAEIYVFDERNRKWLMETNPFALEQIIKRLYEAYQRGLYRVSEDTVKRLREIYSMVESMLEGHV